MSKPSQYAEAYAKGRTDERHRWQKKVWETICYQQLAGEPCDHIDCHALVQLVKDLKHEPDSDL